MKISEIAERYNLSIDTIRYYEKAGLIDPVGKNESGRKVYEEKEMRRINFVKCMRQAGMSIEKIKQYVDLFHEGLETIPERKRILESQLDMLIEQQKELDAQVEFLQKKIANYENTIVKKEKARFEIENI